MSLTRLPYKSAQPVYAAAERWRDRCLVEDRSLFTDALGSRLEDAEVLVRDFVENPDEGGDDFLARLTRQLGQSPASAVQLAAELIFVHLLIARSDAVGGARKRDIVRQVLAISEGTADIPQDLGRVLDAGLVRPGTAFNTYRWRQLAYLVHFVAELKRLPVEQRNGVLSDPHRFVEFQARVGDQGAATQRHALEHLLFPDIFPPVVSRDHRGEILRRWADVAGADSEPEPLRLRQVVEHLGDDRDRFVHLYRSPLVWEWQEPSSKWRVLAAWSRRLLDSLDLDETERNYKLVAAGQVRKAHDALEGGDRQWLATLNKAFTGCNLVGWRAYQPFVQWLENEPASGKQAFEELWREPGPESVDRFLDVVPETVAHTRGARLSIASFLLSGVDMATFPPWRAATVDTAYRLVGYPGAESTAREGEQYDAFLLFLDGVLDLLRREGATLRDRLDAQGLVWAVVSGEPPAHWSQAEKDALRAWRSGKDTLPPEGEPTEEHTTPDDIGESEESLADLAEELYLGNGAFLDETVELLRDSGQVIFYGPPGTGKTYVARRLAHWFAGSGARTRLVQFHPSYAYEDFVEGLRPREGEAGFHRVEGPLVEIARAAEKDDANHVLVIDELNRGHVARVLGELYFLLEYRDEPVRLLYSDQEFRLPPNLYVIGTMNSADRSIALVDTALRRRFYFVPFMPHEEPVSGVLDRYLAYWHPHLQWVARVVRRANELLDDPSVAIGPSYFLRKNLDETWVERVWHHAIRPTLEDRFFGQEHRLAEFDLDKLRAEVERSDDDTAAS